MEKLKINTQNLFNNCLFKKLKNCEIKVVILNLFLSGKQQYVSERKKTVIEKNISQTIDFQNH